MSIKTPLTRTQASRMARTLSAETGLQLNGKPLKYTQALEVIAHLYDYANSHEMRHAYVADPQASALDQPAEAPVTKSAPLAHIARDHGLSCTDLSTAPLAIEELRPQAPALGPVVLAGSTRCVDVEAAAAHVAKLIKEGPQPAAETTVLFAIDTSGSTPESLNIVYGRLFKRIVELSGAQPEWLMHDTDITAYGGGTLIPPRKGGGGTLADCVVQHALSQHPDRKVFVVFASDGMFCAPIDPRGLPAVLARVEAIGATAFPGVDSPTLPTLRIRA